MTSHGPLVLALEASTARATAAVLCGDVVLAERAATMRAGADDALMPAVDAVLRAAGVGPRDLAAVACGAGPGGFTSLRIAGALAKGIAHATGCALVAVPSLALAAARAAAAGPAGEAEWLVSLDALRGERYAARVRTHRDEARVRVSAYDYLGVEPADALAATRSGDVIAVDANQAAPHAAAVAAFTLRGLAAGGAPPDDVSPGEAPGALALLPVDLDVWEPDYGRQAEAQARWEVAHGRPLASAVAPVAPDVLPVPRVTPTDAGRRDAGVR